MDVFPREPLDALPYIDPEPTSAERQAAEAAIRAELSLPASSSESQILSHPRLGPLPSSSPFATEITASEWSRLAQIDRPRLQAIDLTRYEDPAGEGDDDDEADGTSSTTLDDLLAKYRRTAIAHAYLDARLAHLNLLSKPVPTAAAAARARPKAKTAPPPPTLGRHAWLLGNYALEGRVRAQEAALADHKHRVDALTAERQRQQTHEIGPELAALAHTWEAGVDRLLALEVALHERQQQIRQRLADRAAASA